MEGFMGTNQGLASADLIYGYKPGSASADPKCSALGWFFRAAHLGNVFQYPGTRSQPVHQEAMGNWLCRRDEDNWGGHCQQKCLFGLRVGSENCWTDTGTTQQLLPPEENKACQAFKSACCKSGKKFCPIKYGNLRWRYWLSQIFRFP